VVGLSNLKSGNSAERGAGILAFHLMQGRLKKLLWLRHRGIIDAMNPHGGVAMAQMGFFDLSDRYAGLDAKKDPLVLIDAVVPWEEFRPTLEQVWRRPAAERKSRGRAQADGRRADVQHAGAERALKPVRRPDRVSGARSAVVHAVSRPWAGGPCARRQDGLAVSRGSGEGGHGGGAVHAVWSYSIGFISGGSFHVRVSSIMSLGRGQQTLR